MLKETFTYKDYEDNERTEDLFFNLSKAELLDHLDLKDDLEKLQERFSGPERNLSVEEIKEILELVKLFMKLSYGVRADDGKRFIKGEQVWEEFTQTACYEQFLFSLFSDADRAIGFLLNVLPQDLRAEVEGQMPNVPAGVKRPTDRQQKQQRPVQVVELPPPPEERDWNLLTPMEVLDLSEDEREKFKAWLDQQ